MRALPPPMNFKHRYNLLGTQKHIRTEQPTAKLGSRQGTWLVESIWHLAHLSYV